VHVAEDAPEATVQFAFAWQGLGMHSVRMQLSPSGAGA
jgi:hypothetical protein